MQQLTSIREFLLASAREHGFDLAGISGAGPLRELEYFPAWIAEGHAGEMRYLEARNEAGELKRAALANVAPWARSVLACAVNYNSAQPYSTECRDPQRGWISRYAWTGTDYHEAVLAKMRAVEAALHQRVPDVRTWCYVDTGPLVERVFAQHAGIGWTGKNTCIINQQLGSWLFLGVMLTSLELTPGLPAADRCGTCTRCLDACPTDAFLAPYKLDATRCISYLTIEKRGGIPEDLREGIGQNLFGCDICQDVCPWNRRAAVGTVREFQPRTELVNPRLDWISRMNEEEFREVFRGSPVKRAKYRGLRRNVAIAIGNSGDPRLLAEAERLANDADDTVAEHGRWAVEKLKESVGGRQSLVVGTNDQKRTLQHET
ncbi:MAG TPA: tRNA epoxyqueuosine(34) reductase QueG [Clostridia bacterium]|nr:tRNA epoxyqueuosine(34) reductase QueG [Clostridia bacterium]